MCFYSCLSYYVTVLEKRDHLAAKTIFRLLQCYLNIQNYAQILVGCLPLFAYTEKRVLPLSGPFS